MTFSELVRDIEALDLHEVRKNSDGYFEFVISVSAEKELYPLFESYFGPPFKPRHVAPNKLAQAYTYDYGGIEKHQVLYYIERQGLSHCAMIWPWNNGQLATVKVAQGQIKK